MIDPTAAAYMVDYFFRKSEMSSTYQALLEGSWVVISGVRSRVTILITHIRGLITLLIATHEPPSKSQTQYNIIGRSGLVRDSYVNPASLDL